MKHSVLISIVLLLLVFPASAEKMTVQTYKQEFNREETVQVLVTVQEKPVYQLESGNVHLKDHAGNEIRIAPLLRRIRENTHMAVFNIPADIPEGVFTLEVGPVKYVINQTLKELVFSTPLSVKDNGYALQFQPGFLMADENLELKVTSKKGNFNFLIQTPEEITHVYNTTQDILEERSRFFVFSLTRKVSKDLLINFTAPQGNEVIPVFTSVSLPPPQPDAQTQPAESQTQETLPTPIMTAQFTITPTAIIKQMAKGATSEGYLEVINLGNQPLRVDFTLTENLKTILTLNISSLLLSPGSKNTQYLWINRQQQPLTGTYEGKIIAQAASQTEEIPVTLTFGTPQPPAEYPEAIPPSEGKGSAQESAQEQPKAEYGDLDFFKNATYAEPERKRSITPFILVGLFLIVLAVIVFAGRKRKKEQTFDEYLEEVRKRRNY